ncbi:hypothetical protein Tco_1027548 [Tanacetum coccineum]
MKENLLTLVSLNQSAFVPGRRISDNILLTQELMHNYHLDKGTPRCAFIVDIEKALHGYFKGKRGLYQGDPMSPDLFTLVMEVLTLMLHRRVRVLDDFTYHWYCSKLNIINLCFADDLFLFAHGDLDILNVLPFKEGKLPVKYLGVPLVPSRKSSAHSLCEMKKGKAKVAWKVVCLPKREGGLGIRRLEVFDNALITSHIWSLLSHKESLWVIWIHTYKLNGRTLWEIPLHGKISWGWRKILQVRQIVRPFIWAGFRHSSKVIDIIESGSWRWPIEWNSKYPTLDNIDVPNFSSASDKLVWKNYDNVESGFSVATMWSCIRPRVDEVDWHHVVWFSHQIPRHAIHLWLVIKRKLKT